MTTHLERELREQPTALERLFATQRESAERIASLFRRDDVGYVLIASRGSSSNAARYAQYVLGRAHRVPVAFATPSLYTLYGQPPRLDGALVLGISQSGRSPDVKEVLEEAKRQGRPTVAITNDVASPLAAVADEVAARDPRAHGARDLGGERRARIVFGRGVEGGVPGLGLFALLRHFEWPDLDMAGHVGGFPVQ